MKFTAKLKPIWKKGSFKGPKYEKIDIMVYGAGDQEANEANKADEN